MRWYCVHESHIECYFQDLRDLLFSEEFTLYAAFEFCDVFTLHDIRAFGNIVNSYKSA